VPLIHLSGNLPCQCTTGYTSIFESTFNLQKHVFTYCKCMSCMSGTTSL
jgi:hypothetical protein